MYGMVAVVVAYSTRTNTLTVFFRRTTKTKTSSDDALIDLQQLPNKRHRKSNDYTHPEIQSKPSHLNNSCSLVLNPLGGPLQVLSPWRVISRKMSESVDAL